MIRQPAVLLLLWMGVWKAAWAIPVTVNSAPYPGEVYVRTGGGSYHKVSDTTPAIVDVESDGQSDVRVWARVSTFRIATGQYLHYVGNGSLTVNEEEQWDPVNLGIAGALMVGAAVFSVARKGRRGQHRPATTALVAEEGTHIGPYQIVRLIARGGMGAVYQVVDTYGDSYALKIPESALFEDEQFRARFRREVDIGKQLHHPNIVRLYDCNLGEVGPDPYLVMELVDGPSLAQVLSNHPILSIPDAVRLMAGILQALEYGHQRGVIHRDVKPGNILVVGDFPKLTDYGIARLERSSDLTGTGSAIGTPRYMAPEQIQAKYADARADVYAVGVMLFECLTGRTPFESDDPMQLLTNKISIDPPSASSFNPELPPVMDGILWRALARNLEQRYPSAQAFLDDLVGL